MAYNGDNPASTATPFILEDEDDLESASFDMPQHSQPTASANSSDSDPIQVLQAAFPGHDHDAIVAVLVACDNDISTARRTLQLSSSSFSSSTSAAAVSSSSLKKNTHKDTDTDTDTNTQQPSENTDSDAVIASYLQRQERLLERATLPSSSTASASASASASTTLPSTSTLATSSSTPLTLSALRQYHQQRQGITTTTEIIPRQTQAPSKPIKLDTHLMQVVVSSLREIIVPALRGHFEELILPDQKHETYMLLYELKNVQVSALSLPTDNVSIRASVDNSTIYINMMSVNLQLEVGHWKYENRSLLTISDEGRANIMISGLNISIHLQPVSISVYDDVGSFINLSSFRIDHCDVSVDGAVRFKSNGAAADWVYNTMAMVMKPWLVSYVKEAVREEVGNSLISLIRQLENAIGLNNPELNDSNNNNNSNSNSNSNSSNAQSTQNQVENNDHEHARENVVHNTSNAATQPSVPAVE